MRTEYILELCDISGEHKPIAQFHSLTPFTTVNVGDRFDDIGWDRLDSIGVIASPAQPRRYTVNSIKHLVAAGSDALIVKYCLDLKPFSGPDSPIWGILK